MVSPPLIRDWIADTIHTAVSNSLPWLESNYDPEAVTSSKSRKIAAGVISLSVQRDVYFQLVKNNDTNLNVNLTNRLVWISDKSHLIPALLSREAVDRFKIENRLEFPKAAYGALFNMKKFQIIYDTKKDASQRLVLNVSGCTWIGGAGSERLDKTVYFEEDPRVEEAMDSIVGITSGYRESENASWPLLSQETMPKELPAHSSNTTEFATQIAGLHSARVEAKSLAHESDAENDAHLEYLLAPTVDQAPERPSSLNQTTRDSVVGQAAAEQTVETASKLPLPIIDISAGMTMARLSRRKNVPKSQMPMLERTDAWRWPQEHVDGALPNDIENYVKAHKEKWRTSRGDRPVGERLAVENEPPSCDDNNEDLEKKHLASGLTSPVEVEQNLTSVSLSGHRGGMSDSGRSLASEPGSEQISWASSSVASITGSPHTTLAHATLDHDLGSSPTRSHESSYIVADATSEAHEVVLSQNSGSRTPAAHLQTRKTLLRPQVYPSSYEEEELEIAAPHAVGDEVELDHDDDDDDDDDEQFTDEETDTDMGALSIASQPPFSAADQIETNLAVEDDTKELPMPLPQGGEHNPADDNLMDQSPVVLQRLPSTADHQKPTIQVKVTPYPRKHLLEEMHTSSAIVPGTYASSQERGFNGTEAVPSAINSSPNEIPDAWSHKEADDFCVPKTQEVPRSKFENDAETRSSQSGPGRIAQTQSPSHMPEATDTLSSTVWVGPQSISKPATKHNPSKRSRRHLEDDQSPTSKPRKIRRLSDGDFSQEVHRRKDPQVMAREFKNIWKKELPKAPEHTPRPHLEQQSISSTQAKAPLPSSTTAVERVRPISASSVSQDMSDHSDEPISDEPLHSKAPLDIRGILVTTELLSTQISQVRARLSEELDLARSGGAIANVESAVNDLLDDEMLDEKNSTADGLNYYREFKSTYPQYIGSKTQFIQAVVYLEVLDSRGTEPHPSLWDDFVRCYADEYSEYIAKTVGNRMSGRQHYKELGQVHGDFNFPAGAYCLIRGDTISDAIASFDADLVAEYRLAFKGSSLRTSIISPVTESFNPVIGNRLPRTSSIRDTPHVVSASSERTAREPNKKDSFFVTHSQLHAQSKSASKNRSPMATPAKRPLITSASYSIAKTSRREKAGDMPHTDASNLSNDSPILGTLLPSVLTRPTAAQVARSGSGLEAAPPPRNSMPANETIRGEGSRRQRTSSSADHLKNWLAARKLSQSSRTSTPKSTPCSTRFCTKPKVHAAPELMEPETQQWES